jgi:hypothetical protein
MLKYLGTITHLSGMIGVLEGVECSFVLKKLHRLQGAMGG